MARETTPADRQAEAPLANERRSFLWKAGATLSATVASAAATAAVPRAALPRTEGPAAGVGPAPQAGDRETLSRRLGALEDSAAISRLHRELGLAINAGRHQDVAALLAPDATLDFYGALGTEPDPTLLLDHPSPGDAIRVAPDRRSAEARFGCVVRLQSSIVPHGSAGLASLAEMARQQGQASQVWWERGTLDIRYVQVRGAWKIQRLAYQTLDRARSPRGL